MHLITPGRNINEACETNGLWRLAVSPYPSQPRLLTYSQSAVVLSKTVKDDAANCATSISTRDFAHTPATGQFKGKKE